MNAKECVGFIKWKIAHESILTILTNSPQIFKVQSAKRFVNDSLSGVCYVSRLNVQNRNFALNFYYNIVITHDPQRNMPFEWYENVLCASVCSHRKRIHNFLFRHEIWWMMKSLLGDFTQRTWWVGGQKRLCWCNTMSGSRHSDFCIYFLRNH